MKNLHSLPKIQSSEITPKSDYLNRRDFLVAAGTGSLALLAACSGTSELELSPTAQTTSTQLADLGSELTTFEDVINYNNYYEFTTDKGSVARLASEFPTRPWQVEIGGLVHNPQVIDIDDLISRFPIESRVYRMRCVEAWSMVIPWNGFPLSALLNAVEPMTSARYIRFETILDPAHMPGQNGGYYPWPYIEGLRLDEGLNDLTLLSTGLYDDDLLPQNGAPLRLVVPWKYGFKSIKSIVRIDLVEEMPVSFWMALAPNEYGFYANVNPQVSHPRWSQSTERRIGESGRRDTLLFNGYGDQVSHLYSNLDLSVNF